MIEPREFLTRVFRAGVAAADPERATRQAVDALDDLASSVWVIAVGKGAHRMASGAVEALRERKVPIAGGLVVANELDPAATHGLEVCVGDHPTPGAGSFAAADRLAAITAQTTVDADAIVLVSGGATSLIAAPDQDITQDLLRETFGALLGSGADIGLMNAVRKRLLRFGAGRLALALRTRRIHCLIASDVIGNDPASIASGPCVPDTSSAIETRRRLRASGAWDALPSLVRNVLEGMAEGRVPDAPRADHPRFASTSVRIILDRTDAERGAADEANKHDVAVTVRSEPLEGEASIAGRRFVSELLGRRDHGRRCTIWSGETTVTLAESRSAGGRCQEFALAAAIGLEEAGDKARSLTILAAGTDGRDGPTDAAGAIVDASTCSRMRAAGVDPPAVLAAHDSYRALDLAAALLKTGPTGTNVNDLVVGYVSAS
jgi:glycerate 2-kinase